MHNAKNQLPLPPCLRVKEVKSYLGLSLDSTYRLVRSKEFPKIHIGNSIIIPTDKFLEWIDNHMEGCENYASKK